MEQTRGRSFRRVCFTPAQPPLQHGLKHLKAVDHHAVGVNRSLHRYLLRVAKEIQSGLGRQDAMDARQVGAQVSRQLWIAFSAQLAGEPVTGGDAGHPRHDEKCPPMHRGVFAQPEWLRHLDASTVDRAQHREFLRAAEALL
ncbi:hypothetical protein D3C86_1823040 [compost metagenome]